MVDDRDRNQSRFPRRPAVVRRPARLDLTLRQPPVERRRGERGASRILLDPADVQQFRRHQSHCLRRIGDLHSGHRIGRQPASAHRPRPVRRRSPRQPPWRHCCALGDDSGLIPFELDERSALLRSTPADHRALILLDNARDTNQVRPPPGTIRLVIVASRNQLRGLSIHDHAAKSPCTRCRHSSRSSH
jgi:hypothetical protein